MIQASLCSRTVGKSDEKKIVLIDIGNVLKEPSINEQLNLLLLRKT